MNLIEGKETLEDLDEIIDEHIKRYCSLRDGLNNYCDIYFEVLDESYGQLVWVRDGKQIKQKLPQGCLTFTLSIKYVTDDESSRFIYLFHEDQKGKYIKAPREKNVLHRNSSPFYVKLKRDKIEK